MTARWALAALCPLVLAVAPAPVTAAPNVTAEATTSATGSGDEVFVVALCDARANVGAVATQVTCSIGDGAIEATQTFPSNAAVATLSGVVARPAYICLTATASYLDGSTSVAPHQCHRIAI